jgi:hypothetical protein
VDWKDVGGQGFNLAFFANNALNKHYADVVFDLRGVLGVQTYIPAIAATYGVQLTVPFGSGAGAR